MWHEESENTTNPSVLLVPQASQFTNFIFFSTRQISRQDKSQSLGLSKSFCGMMNFFCIYSIWPILNLKTANDRHEDFSKIFLIFFFRFYYERPKIIRLNSQNAELERPKFQNGRISWKAENSLGQKYGQNIFRP